MTKLIKKVKSDIKFDSNYHYVNKHNNKQFGRGVWYRDNNGNGKYDKGEQLIKPGNRIRNNDFSYSQLNSDGTVTKLSDNKGNVTKGLENKLSDVDKYAMKHKLVYGRMATYNDKTKKWERTNNNPIQWDTDTERNEDDIDINNNKQRYLFLPGGYVMSAIQQTKNGNYTEAVALLPNHNKLVNFGTAANTIPKKTYEFMQKIAYPIPKTDVTQNKTSQNTQNTNDEQNINTTYWDLNPNGGSYTRGKSKLTYGQIDDGEGLNGSGYNDVDDAYRKAWLAVNPQAKAPGRGFWGHNIFEIFKKDRNLDIRKEYVSQYENDLNNWLSKYYAVNPTQNKSIFNPDHKYLRKSFTQKDTKNNDVTYVPLFTGDQWGFGVREYMDANGNTTYQDYNGNVIPGLIMKNGKPYIPANTPGKYFKTGGKLIKRQNNGIQRKFN